MKNIDLMMIALKEDLNIELTDEEKKCLSNLDNEEKNMILDLLRNSSYREDLLVIIDKIINDYSEYDNIVQEDVLKKCNERKQKIYK